MKIKRAILKIENSCSQKWNEMEGSSDGKFCLSCSKNVIDFTFLSDKEILKVLEQATGKVCGRLNASQHNRLMVTHKSSRSFPVVYKLLTSLMLVPAPILLLASTKPKLEVVSKVISKANERDLAVVHQDSITKQKAVFSGRVVDEGGEAIIGATMVIKGTNIKTSTDINGYFSIPVPDNFKSRSVTFTISALGYQIMERSLTKNQLTRKKEWVLKSDVMILGEIAFVVE